MKSIWNESNIRLSQARIKLELDLVEKREGIAGRQTHLLNSLRKLEQQPTPQEALDFYIYIMSTLVLHGRAAFLSEGQYKSLIETAMDLLYAQGIHEQHASLSFLHAELHFIRSQIARRQGNHWEAALLQYLGNAFGHDNPQGRGFQNFALGHRAMRLGHLRLAIDLMVEGAATLDNDLQLRCLLSLATCYRLRNEISQSQDTLDTIRSMISEASPYITELTWEEAQLNYLESLDLAPILKLTEKDAPCYKTSYIVESCLLAMAHPDRGWLKKIPKIENLRRRKTLEVSKDSFLAFVRILQEAYDKDRPASQRLHRLATCLSNLSELYNVEKELLYWAAATRCLQRNAFDTLARLTLSEYHARCRTMSDGLITDAYRLFTSQRIELIPNWKGREAG